jgi:hypothetical protein
VFSCQRVAWLALAEIESGPASLTIFLGGEHAGRVFFVAPQPPFNVLRPIARSFHAPLGRIADDVVAFLRLVGVTVNLRGPDGANYGFVPIEYLPTGTTVPAPQRRTRR